KLSPLSDTTNLAPLVVDVNLYDHIKHMLFTTLPASIIGIIIWGGLGLKVRSGTDTNNTAVNSMLTLLDSIFNWNVFMLLPFIIILWCAFRICDVQQFML